MIDCKNVRIIEMDIDMSDYPDCCDSYIMEAEFIDTGEELTGEEIDDLNENHHGFVLESIWDYLY